MAWKANCHVTKMNTYNPRYQASYEDFFLSKSASAEFSGFFKSKDSFYKTIAIVHQLQIYSIYNRVASWSNAFVDFLDPRYNPHTCISQMHALGVLIVNALKKSCTKEKIGVILFEALKACVGLLDAGFPASQVEYCVVHTDCHLMQFYNIFYYIYIITYVGLFDMFCLPKMFPRDVPRRFASF